MNDQLVQEMLDACVPEESGMFMFTFCGGVFSVEAELNNGKWEVLTFKKLSDSEERAYYEGLN